MVTIMLRKLDVPKSCRHNTFYTALLVLPLVPSGGDTQRTTRILVACNGIFSTCDWSISIYDRSICTFDWSISTVDWNIWTSDSGICTCDCSFLTYYKISPCVIEASTQSNIFERPCFSLNWNTLFKIIWGLPRQSPWFRISLRPVPTWQVGEGTL